VDLDGDGRIDLLSGSYSRMESSMAGLFHVLWGNSDKTFKKAECLNGSDSQPLIIPIAGRDQQVENICTRPTAADWDGDGDLDLVVGNFAGTFYVFNGEGKGKFQPKPQMIMLGKEPLRIVGAHSDPVVVDWDGDGDFDLLSGSSNGGVQWSENSAGKGKPPELMAFKTLIEPGVRVDYGEPLSEGDLTGPTTSTRIWVDDVNSDGKLDILVGDSVTLVAMAKGLTKKEFEERKQAWQKEQQTALADLNSTDTEKRQKAIESYQKLYSKRSEFIIEDRTGFVWLYLQK
jgi:hypothetical protein